MSQYYFTIASLPALLYSSKPSINIADFLESCSRTLKPVDYERLQKVVLDHPHRAPGEIPFLKLWQTWELNLRNTLAGLRAKEKGISAEAYLQPCAEDFSARQTAAAAFAEEAPLKADEIIEKARWHFLSEQEVAYHFDLEKVIIYYLKLQLLLRKYAFESARGQEKYHHILHKYLDLLKTRENTNV